METATPVKVQQPDLIAVGRRELSTRGYRSDLFLQHLKKHLGDDTWCSVDCAARLFSGRVSQPARHLMRSRIAPAFRWLLSRDYFLVVEFAERGHGRHGEILKFRLFRPLHATDAERHYAEQQLARLEKRWRLTSESVAKGQALITGGSRTHADQDTERRTEADA